MDNVKYVLIWFDRRRWGAGLNLGDAVIEEYVEQIAAELHGLLGDDVDDVTFSALVDAELAAWLAEDALATAAA